MPAADHVPVGDPCTGGIDGKCGLAPHQHRPHHNPQGDPCKQCSLPARQHRVKHAPDHKKHCSCGAALSNHLGRTRSEHEQAAKKELDKLRTHAVRRYYLGIDGEGQGRDDHKYILLCTNNADGSRRDCVEAAPGERLTTEQCLDFILRQPIDAKIFSYAFNYDLTKILTDVDDEILYKLFRPELRPPSKPKLPPHAVYWGGYSLNLLGTKFTVKKDGRRRVVWDIFRFFQSKFTKALEEWHVGEKDRLARMREMKDKRAEFDKQDRKTIRAYCFDECRDMAALAEKLDEAHMQAGLKLRSYYGAGSSAGVMLKNMSIEKQVREGPAEMKPLVAAAFFGGRFEHSVIGAIPGPVWSYDISSAYPYQLYQLPCLGCGQWSQTTNRRDLDRARTALVRYSLGRPPKNLPWGPFPFRLKNGSICFPSTSGGGWIWMSEFLAAEKLFPHVRFQEAWIYETDCDHRPFAEIPGYYNERLRLGKDGPGLVIKLGTNSCYGKLAQSIGAAPPYQSWIWAGMITAGTRAQILEMLGLHKDPSNMLMIATDGIYTREKITAPKPIETGTYNCQVCGTAARKIGEPCPKGCTSASGQPMLCKPLGGWERKVVKKGIFAARPGIYFPLNPTEEETEKVRARGVGRAVMQSNWEKMVDAWKTGEKSIHLADLTRFCGAKSSIGPRKVRLMCPKCGEPPPEIDDAYYKCHRCRFVYDRRQRIVFVRSKSYGQWLTRPIELSFDPLPKRERIKKDGVTLEIRRFKKTEFSTPYNRALFSPEARALKAASDEMMEQPDGGDFTDYSDDDTFVD